MKCMVDGQKCDKQECEFDCEKNFYPYNLSCPKCGAKLKVYMRLNAVMCTFCDFADYKKSKEVVKNVS